VPATAAEDRTYRKIINSWCIYDWANSAFATTIMAAMFPPFYRSLATGPGLSEANATAARAYTSSIALLIIASLAPVLGAISDHTGGENGTSPSLPGWASWGRGCLSCLAKAPTSWPLSCSSWET
jgi:MFS-type transporter involved in bile tolerance (Atg22 family)